MATPPEAQDPTSEGPAGGLGALDLLLPMVAGWKLLLIGPVLAAMVGVAASYWVQPTFTAAVVFMPPAQQQGQAAAALASLGALASLAGAGSAGRTPADQYLALMQSNTINDRIVDQFDLINLYGVEKKADARKQLGYVTRFGVGKKDNLIRVEVDDTDPARAAKMANAYLEELRKLSANLALSEAQQRRIFFEGQLQQSRDRLVKAQERMEASGISPATLRTEPRAAADAYARLRAETTAAQIKLQAMRQSLSDRTPEVVTAQSVYSSLSAQLQAAERAPAPSGPDTDYITRYREFKYQETLFDLFARQYELARVDEARDGALFQVVDAATPPERKSKPRRALIALACMGASFLLLALGLVVRGAWKRAAIDPSKSSAVYRLRRAWKGEPY